MPNFDAMKTDYESGAMEPMARSSYEEALISGWVPRDKEPAGWTTIGAMTPEIEERSVPIPGERTPLPQRMAIGFNRGIESLLNISPGLGTAVMEPFVAETSKPISGTERILERGAEEVALSMPATGLIGKAAPAVSQLASRVGPQLFSRGVLTNQKQRAQYVSQMIKPLTDMAEKKPATFAALETISAFFGGGTGEIFRGSVEDFESQEIEDAAEFLGNMVGSVGIGAAHEILQNIKRPTTKAARKAAEMLYEGVKDDPFARRAAGEAGKLEDVVGGVRLTTPEVTGDPVLAARYKARAGVPGEFAGRAEERALSNLEALRSYAVSPQRTLEGRFTDTLAFMQAQRDALENAVKTSEKEVLGALQSINPNLSEADAGELVRSALQGQEGALKETYRALRAQVDPAADFPLEGQPMLDEVSRWLTEKPYIAKKRLPALLESWKRDLGDKVVPKTKEILTPTGDAVLDLHGNPVRIPTGATKQLPISFEEVESMRSTLFSEQQYHARTDPGNKTIQKVIGDLQRATEDMLGAWSKDGQIPHETLDSYRKSAANFREYAASSAKPGGKHGFRTKRILDALKAGDEGFSVPDESLVGLFWKKGAGGRRAIQSFRDALGSSREYNKVAKALEDYATWDMMNSPGMITDEGLVNPKAYQRWMTAHRFALDAFPRVKLKFKSLTAASTRMKIARAKYGGFISPKRRARRAAMSAMLGDTPATAIDRLMADAGAMREALKEASGNKKALEGIKDGVWDWMDRKFSATMPEGSLEGDVPAYMSGKLKEALDPRSKTRQVLNEVLTKKDFVVWENTQRMAERFARLNKGTSRGSVQDLGGAENVPFGRLLAFASGGKTRAVLSTAMGTVTPASGAIAGYMGAGVPGAAAGAGAGWWMKRMSRLSQEQLMKLVDEALLDPTAAKHLWQAKREGIEFAARRDFTRLVVTALGRDVWKKIDGGVEAENSTRQEELKFMKWYSTQAKALDLNPDPDDPEHFYDWRAAWESGAKADSSGHWPSEFKKEGHPNLFVRDKNGNLIDSRTGQVQTGERIR